MKINNVYKTYDTNTGQKVQALKGVSFDLPSTGMVAILGKSGSGKSTLLNILSGLDSFDSGDIEAFGKNMRSFSQKELDHYRNSCVGFVFQEYHLIPELTVGDNIAVALQLQGQSGTEEKVKDALKLVELVGYESRKIDELSGGQKQRVAIARALVKNPKIIFADEPTGALDSETGESILQILKGISKEKLVILVTHDREFAERYGDRIIELSDGVVINDTDNTYRFAEAEEAMNMRKPRMPLKTALKIGCSNFKHHPFRLFSTILLSVIAFSLLGISLTIAFMNPVEVYSDALMDSDIKFTAIYKRQWYVPTGWIEYDQSLDQFLGAERRNWKDAPITKDDVEFLKSKVGGSYTLVYSAIIDSFQDSYVATRDQLAEALAKKEKEYSVAADGYIAMTKEECDKMGYVLIGRLPENSSEVAINEGIFNTFSLAGLIEENKVYDISSYEDIIGRKIPIINNRSWNENDYKTITGVVITGCDYECFNSHYQPEDRLNHWNWEHYHDKIFVCQDYFNEYTYALRLLPKNETELVNFIDFIISYEENDFYFKDVNKLSSGFYSSYNFAKLLKNLCLYLCVLFLFFALLLLSNFIFTSMRRQMKQIGILSALGAGFKDLCKVYGSAIGVMCSAIMGISLITNILGVNWFNSFLRADDPYLYFDIVPFSFLALLILVVIIAAISAAGFIIPLIRLRKIDPTKIINKGQVK
ncbi:MAG: ABC transporter ATP-binding protein/permease [Ruminococcaceae bacterium]|nr:ABC transporter ATP-binding protein/permease [Oscillospiraceae bacterium]